MTMRPMIPNPVTLLFDPASPPRDEEEATIRKVFADPTARMLWLAIRPSHIVDQYFHDGCLNLAAVLKRHGTPQTVKELKLRFSQANRHGLGMYIYGTEKFLEELLPYVQGQQELAFIVKAKEPAP